MVLIRIIKLATSLHFRSNPGFWIGAIMRTSTNESMNFRCKLLHHRMNLSLPYTEDILCLYYDFSQGEVRADTCNSNKPFICMNPNFGKYLFVFLNLLQSRCVWKIYVKNKLSILTNSTSLLQKYTLFVPFYVQEKHATVIVDVFLLM